MSQQPIKKGDYVKIIKSSTYDYIVGKVGKVNWVSERGYGMEFLGYVPVSNGEKWIYPDEAVKISEDEAFVRAI